VDKENMVFVHHEILFNHKKEWNDITCMKMVELEIIILNERSQAQKKKNPKYHMLSIIGRI
jgi:hypothetical protein